MAATSTARWTYRMLANENLWQVAHDVHDSLSAAAVPHAVVGGVAVCLHGYRRNTVDLDLLVRPTDADAVRGALNARGYVWDAAVKEFRSASGVPVQFVMAGERQGKGQESNFPDPADPRAVVAIEELPVLSLAELVQSKIACGLGNVRRAHKDFADVVELIALHHLDGSFARLLHKSVRKEFRALVRNANAGE